MGASTAATEPLPPPRPESGRGLACACCAWVDWGGPWASAGAGTARVARHTSRVAPVTEGIGEYFVCERFISMIPYGLAELFAESRGAERDQYDGEEEQGQEVRPQIGDSAALEHASADDGCEVVDWIRSEERRVG